MSAEQTVILIGRNAIGRWEYAPAALWELFKIDYSDRWAYETPEDCERGARADPSIPPGALFVQYSPE